MPTTVDVPRSETPPHRRGGRARWVAVVVLVAAVAAALAIRGIGSATEAPEQALHSQLAARVAALLEQTPRDEHLEHGHHFGDDGQIICAAEPFGFDPVDATTMDQVRVVYSHHLCAVVVPGLAWEYSLRASGPLAVELTDPPTLTVPAGGDGYPDRVRAAIAERYHDEAFTGFLSEQTADDLRKRFNSAHRRG